MVLKFVLGKFCPPPLSFRCANSNISLNRKINFKRERNTFNIHLLDTNMFVLKLLNRSRHYLFHVFRVVREIMRRRIVVVHGDRSFLNLLHVSEEYKFYVTGLVECGYGWLRVPTIFFDSFRLW